MTLDRAAIALAVTAMAVATGVLVAATHPGRIIRPRWDGRWTR